VLAFQGRRRRDRPALPLLAARGADRGRARKGQTHYRRWVEEGWLTATPGECIDYGFIRQEINALGKLYDIGEIAFDPWNATQAATELGDRTAS
jgi:phage terminase large subunit-like protein